jgi:hypothetical protein
MGFLNVAGMLQGWQGKHSAYSGENQVTSVPFVQQHDVSVQLFLTKMEESL